MTPTRKAVRGELSRVGASIAIALLSCTAHAQPAPAVPVGLNEVVVQGAAAKQALERNMLRLDVAEKIAKACFDFARRNNHRVSVHVVDQFGNAIYVGRMDGQTSDNIDSARLKARTAVYFREPTSIWVTRTRADPMMAIWVYQLGQFAAAGGLPIIVEDQLLGAIGVGGSAENEACAEEALTTVLGPQPVSADP